VCGFIQVCNYRWDQSSGGEAAPVLQSVQEAEQNTGKKLSVEKPKNFGYESKIMQLLKLFYSFMVYVVSQLSKLILRAKQCFSATCCLKLN